MLKKILWVIFVLIANPSFAEETLRVGFTPDEVAKYWDGEGMLANVSARGTARVSEFSKIPPYERNEAAVRESRSRCYNRLLADGINGAARNRVRSLGYDPEEIVPVVIENATYVIPGTRVETTFDPDGDTVVTTCRALRDEVERKLSLVALTFQIPRESDSSDQNELIQLAGEPSLIEQTIEMDKGN